MTTELTQEQFEAFIDQYDSRFRFAKTMANIPHAYIIRHEVKDERFDLVTAFILKNGYQKKFYSRTYTYFDYKGHQYWTAGDGVKPDWVLNRAKL